MMHTLFLLSLFPLLGWSQRTAATPFDQIKKNGHDLESMVRIVANRRHQPDKIVLQYPNSVETLDTFTLRRTANSLYATHLVIWSHDTAGCTHTLPNATISCGLGGKITLIEQDPSVQGCTVSASQNSIVCASAAAPDSAPSVIVVCTGTTAVAKSATLRVPASVAKCTGKLTSTTRGGSASVVGYLGRYCSKNGNSYRNSNYTCTSGTKNSTLGIGLCVAKKSCATSSSTSCSASVGAVAISDTDSRSECIGQGPNATAVPFSIHYVYWGAASSTCTISAINTVTITCKKSGTITILKKNASAISSCIPVGKSVVKCTKKATTKLASVLFSCEGRGRGQLDALAALPSITATQCSSTTTPNSAIQVMYMDRLCGTTSLDLYAFDECGGAAISAVDSSGDPFCGTLKSCTSTAQSKCSVTLGSITISDETTAPSCIFV